jgi:hypothetical protein
VTDQTPEPLKNEKLFLSKLVDQVAANRQYGSFSERNPQFGPMRTCHICHTRYRFALGHPCWRYAVVSERETPPTKGRQNSHTHANGQRNVVPPNLVHQVTLEWQRDPAVMRAALNAMQFGITDAMLQDGQIKPQLVPALAEKFVTWKQRTKQKFLRRQRDVARRVNLGLLAPGSRP